MKPVILKGKRIVLRPLRMNDTKVLWKYINDPGISRYLEAHPPISLKQEREFVKKSIKSWKSGDELIWGVEHKESGKLIGTCALHLARKHDRATYGLWLAKEYHRQGYGKEMTILAMSFGFRKLKLNRLEYSVFPKNKASIALIESLGGKYEGKRRQYFKKGSKYYDDYVYSILRKEWKK
jgi:ribosomal-protein-alanine N-acetyltransferase